MHGKATLLDVSVTHPCTSTNLAGAATTRLSAARKREQKKDSMYRASSQRVGKYFVPLVFETYDDAVTLSLFTTSSSASLAVPPPMSTLRLWPSLVGPRQSSLSPCRRATAG
jgi:hypothetical protein